MSNMYKMFTGDFIPQLSNHSHCSIIIDEVRTSWVLNHGVAKIRTQDYHCATPTMGITWWGWDQEYRIFVLVRSGLLQSSGCQIRKKFDEIMINNCNSMLQWAPINFQNWFQTITTKEPLSAPRGSRHHKHTMSMPVYSAALLYLGLLLIHMATSKPWSHNFVSFQDEITQKQST